MLTERDGRILPAGLCILSLLSGCSTNAGEAKAGSETQTSTSESASDSSDSSVATTTPEPTTGTTTGYVTETETSESTGEPSTTDSGPETTEGETTDAPSCDDAVAFADPNFEAALRAQLMLDEGEALCESALAELPTTLDLSGWQISDLTGLATLAHVTDLGLQDNAISDIAPVADLVALTRLDLSHNPVSDLSALTVMPELHEVLVNNTEVSSLLDLGQTQVKIIAAQHTLIADVTPIAAIDGLLAVDLEGSQVTDLSPLLDAVWLNESDCVELRFNACDLSVESLDSVVLQVCASGHQMYWDGGVGSCNVDMCM